MRLIFVLIINSLFVSCFKGKPATIIIQPFGNISIGKVDIVKDSLSRYFTNVRIQTKEDLPAEAWYEPRKRYKANRILLHLKNKLQGSDSYMIGLTTTDISTDKKGNDWGVMGLAFQKGNVCVASTFRLDKNNVAEQLFKVAIHELGHNFGLAHCPEKSCFMRDAEGGRPLNEEKAFCRKCHSFLAGKNVFKRSFSPR